MISVALSLARLVAGPLFDYLSTMEKNKITREALEAKLAEVISNNQADILQAEIKGESWLQRNWRPMVALVSFFSYWFVIFLFPFLISYEILPAVRFGEVGLENFWNLTMICVGGYMGARTVEKVTEKIITRNQSKK